MSLFPAQSVPSTFVRWWKFNLVGAIGIAVQFAVLFVLKSAFGMNYLLATAIAVEAAVIHNFLWHEQFTWVDRIKIDRVGIDRGNFARLKPAPVSSWRGSVRRLVRFHIANGAISLLGNLVLMRMLAGYGRVNYLVANGVAIALCSVANFLVSNEWVFEG